MVDEFNRRGARAAFRAIDNDEIWRDIGFQHGFDNGEPFPRMTDAKLETYRFAAGQLTQASDEVQ